MKEKLAATQGQVIDLGGYYKPDDAKLEATMRPSPTLNRIMALKAA